MTSSIIDDFTKKISLKSLMISHTIKKIFSVYMCSKVDGEMRAEKAEIKKSRHKHSMGGGGQKLDKKTISYLQFSCTIHPSNRTS
jgi:hypothetical protein